MSSRRCSELGCLSRLHINALERADIKTIDALLLTSPSEISKKAKLPLNQVNAILHQVYAKLSPPNLGLSSLKALGKRRATFTTGDATLDDAIGGGVRTGMVWEFVGEGAAGKTQLALQLSLLVQLPEELGGLCGSTCYLSTFSNLPTKRLLQLINEHPGLSAEHCSLSNIHSCYTPTTQVLVHALTSQLPVLLKEIAGDPNRKRVRLLVIDSIADLFRASHGRTANSLFERAKELHDLSTKLHALCSEHDLPVVIINGVTDSFTYDPPPTKRDSNNDIVYREQAKWFTRAHSLPAEVVKEAGLGLVWANQVNVRVMFTRTGRRKYAQDVEAEVEAKRLKQSEGDAFPTPATYILEADDESVDQTVHIRRLSVVFSSISSPSSIDYIITKRGLSTLSEIFTPNLPNYLQTPQSNKVPKSYESADLPSQPPPEGVEYESGDESADEDDSYWNMFDEINDDLILGADDTTLDVPDNIDNIDANVDEDV